MAFRSRANIDPNQHKGIIISNSADNTALVPTGSSLTNSQPMHVAMVDSAGSQITPGALVTAPLVGQAKIAITGTAVRLNGGTTQSLTNGIIISAKSGNTASITIGTSGVTNTVDGTGNGYILAAGASISFAVTNTNVIYINGTAGDVVSWAGS